MGEGGLPLPDINGERREIRVAKPIRQIHRIEYSEEEIKDKHLAEIETALITHKTAVLEGLDLLQGLHDRGVLPLLVGLLQSGEQVLAVLVNELNKPENTQAFRNIVGLVQTLGALDAEQLGPLIKGLNRGLRTDDLGEQSRHGGLFGLLKALRDPETNAGMMKLLAVLKGIGKETGSDRQ